MSVDEILDHLHEHEPDLPWKLELVYNGPDDQLYRGYAAGESEVAVKFYRQRSRAEREFAVLTALRDFGINLGPEPLGLDAERPIVVMSWVGGEPLTVPPSSDDTELWHKYMAAVGATGAMPFSKYASRVPMAGGGFQGPRDMLDRMRSKLASLSPENPALPRLQALLDAAEATTPEQWNMPPKACLCRGRYALSDFLYDGCCHVLAVDWESADWGDMAAELGLWISHPDYADLPASHWTWFRWEFARLTQDEDLVSRATVYSKSGLIWWALALAESNDQPATLERTLARAEKAFRLPTP